MKAPTNDHFFHQTGRQRPKMHSLPVLTFAELARINSHWDIPDWVRNRRKQKAQGKPAR